MDALRKTHQRSKKNPYAERGLDKFALLSAELEQKREKLVAQLGSSLSIVRFAVGSDHHNWVPVIACPTLSSSELHNLRGTATRLIAEDEPAINHSYGGVESSAASHKEGEMMQAISNITSKDLMTLPHDATSAGADRRSAQKSERNGGDAARTSHQTAGALRCRLVAASERFLGMAGFIFSVLVDILRSLILLKWSAADVAASPSRLVRSFSSWKRADHPPASLPSSSVPSSVHTPASPPSPAAQSSNLPLIRTRASRPAGGAIAASAAAGPPAQVEAYKGRSRGKRSSAPSTPRDSRQACRKSFQASASFPKMVSLQDEDEAAARSSAGITTARDSTFLKSVSLPTSSAAQQPQSHCALPKSQTALRVSPATLSTKETADQSRMKARKERSQNLGQALTGAGLALGLGGLVMGFIPAIVCIACWWYALPSMRRAVGDKPRVKSHPSSKLRATADQQ